MSLEGRKAPTMPKGQDTPHSGANLVPRAARVTWMVVVGGRGVKIIDVRLVLP
jgi:hypothetical protein